MTKKQRAEARESPSPARARDAKRRQVTKKVERVVKAKLLVADCDRLRSIVCDAGVLAYEFIADSVAARKGKHTRLSQAFWTTFHPRYTVASSVVQALPDCPDNEEISEEFIPLLDIIVTDCP